MKTINKFMTGVVAVTAFTLVSCSGGKTAPENGKGAEEANAGATQEVKTYKVGTNPVFAPFEYTNEANDILGFDIDVMDAIAKDRNVKFTYKNLPWDGIFASLESGDVDVLSAAITITDDRKQRMDFSDPYYEVTQLIVLPKGKQVNNVEELKSLGKIGVVNAQTGDILMQQYLGPTSSKIARYDTLPLMFKEIQAGGADAGVSDSAAILYYMKSNPDMGGYSLVKFDDFPLEKYGMAVNKGNAELLDLINTGLKNIRANGTYDKIMGKYFSESQTKELSSKVAAAADEAGEAVKEAADKAEGKFDELKNEAGAALENAKNATEEAGQNLKEKAAEAVDATKQAASDAVEKTKEFAHDAAEATKEAGAAAKEKAADAIDATKDAAGAAVDKTKELAGAAVNKTKEVAHDAAEATREAGAAAKEKAADAVDSTKEAAGAAVDKTKEVAHDAAEATREAGAAAKEKAADAVDATKDAAGAAVDKTKEVAHDAAEATREAGAAAKEKAADAVDATKDAAGAAVDKTKEVAGAAVDKTKEVAGNALDAVKNAAHNAAEKVAEATE